MFHKSSRPRSTHHVSLFQRITGLPKPPGKTGIDNTLLMFFVSTVFAGAAAYAFGTFFVRLGTSLHWFTPVSSSIVSQVRDVSLLGAATVISTVCAAIAFNAVRSRYHLDSSNHFLSHREAHQADVDSDRA